MIEVILKTKFDKFKTEFKKLPDFPKSDIDLNKFQKNAIVSAAALMGVPKKYLQVVNEYAKWQREQDEKEFLEKMSNHTG